MNASMALPVSLCCVSREGLTSRIERWLACSRLTLASTLAASGNESSSAPEIALDCLR